MRELGGGAQQGCQGRFLQRNLGYDSTDREGQREHYPNSRRDLKGSRNYKGRLA